MLPENLFAIFCCLCIAHLLMKFNLLLLCHELTAVNHLLVFGKYRCCKQNENQSQKKHDPELLFHC
ncbi:MAG: hypothetical protein C0403_13590 [Desulfobacterium sp.]|nr:hypothetical protein [Desulfobacterium sp.]